MPYVTTNLSLPRSLDVQISLSKAQAESRTDLSILCVACEDLGFSPNNRIRFYSTIEAVEQDFVAGTEAHFAASAFFSQSPHAPVMAIGEVFLDEKPAVLESAALTAAEIAAIAAVTNGRMKGTYNPGTGAATYTFAGMDFSGVTTIEGVAAVINAAAVHNLSCTVKTLPGGSKCLVIRTVAVGDGTTISYPVDSGVGVFVGDLLNLTSAKGGSVMNGYSSPGIADQLSSIAAAANAAGKFVYGWCLGASLRDVAVQTAAAAWALTRTAFMPLVTNDITALDPTYDEDLGSVLAATGNKRAVALYHDNVQRYPDVSILAYMLHVNYKLPDSTVTAKFKTLPGIETVQLTETEWIALQGKGYNTYTAIGNDARTFRDGITEDTNWFMDTVINMDNFVEDLSVNIYNVFLRNKKIPYTRTGQMLLVDACKDTGYQYTFNGTFADREELDTTSKSGYAIIPAVQVIPTAIALMTAADRAGRTGPPIQMVVQEAGAIHSVAVNVELVS